MRPITLRSASVRYANVAMTRLMTTSASIRLTHQSTSVVAATVVERKAGGDVITSPPHPRFGGEHALRLHHLDGRMEVARMLLGDTRDALHELAADSGTKLDRCSV